MIKRLLLAVALLVTLIGSGFYFLYPTTLGVGTALPDAPALFETSLAAPITSTATSFSLTTNAVRGGGTLSGYQCFTIDEGSAQAEFVCGQASSTSITGVTRGISPSDGVSEVTALKFAHRRGASVKITDFPLVQILRNQNNGSATFENVLTYASGVTPSSADQLADVGYVLSVVTGGTVNFDALVVAGTAGETLATGTLVYFKTSDQRWWKVNTTDTTTFQSKAVGITRGAGVAAGSVSNGGVLLQGAQTGLSGLTAGWTYYASSSAGTFSTATSVLPIGFAKSTTELMFNPVSISSARLGFNNTFTGANTFSGTTTFSGALVGATKIDVYTASSTWTKPTNAKAVTVFMFGGGGGGGGGAKGVNVGSGGGGGGGGFSSAIFAATDLSSTENITVGSGGTFGAGKTGADGGGSSGANGINTSFGTKLIAVAGTAGSGAQTAGAGGLGNIETGTTGGAGSAGGGAGAGATAATYAAATGGGGGGGNTLPSNGGPGGSKNLITQSGGIAGVTVGGSGGNGVAFSYNVGGTGGGGGAGSNSAAGGVGGNGALYGGGGAGGGAGLTAGGNGGTGANGVVIVITY